jgi:hypothetical protein
MTPNKGFEFSAHLRNLPKHGAAAWNKIAAIVRARMLVSGGLLCGVLLVAAYSQSPTAKSAASTDNVPPGNEACASCHAEIYKSYSKTVMASASGLAADGFIAGEFTNKASGVTFRVYEKDAGSRAALGPSGSETRTHTKTGPTRN